MTIRIFNPDHDLALAANQKRFTAPHAGRQLRSDLGFLPALWAEDGDVIVVDDVDASEADYRKLKYVEKRKVEFVTMVQIPDVLRTQPDAVFNVWGWNKSLCFQLMQCGVPASYLPTDEQLDEIRVLSGRQMTTDLLRQIRLGVESATCGESTYCTSEEQVQRFLQSPCVLKAPWSSSGRGVRYIVENEEERHLQNTINWMRRIIATQGGVMAEPLYNKVKDFAMEFVADGEGGVEYCGLSLFSTVNGAYTGNLLLSEEEKREMLAEYVDVALLDEIIERIKANVRTGSYRGAFGVDMMIVANGDGFIVHPCVEVNLRRTMGHVALALSAMPQLAERKMCIDYISKTYKLLFLC